MPRWFTLKDFGQPWWWEASVTGAFQGREDWGLERRRSEQRHGVPKQRAGSLHR
ncbi:hypothetical protein L209DRAFT_755715 [Thermothelomyces heterothallicus CBS 203.75]